MNAMGATARSVLIAFALVSCAGLTPRADPPRVTVADVRLVDAGLLSQTYGIRLQIQNPNPVALPIDGMSYELRFNDRPFASGVNDRRITVPRYGTAVLEVEAIGTLADLFQQLTQLERMERQTFRYSLRGRVSLKGAEAQLPFEQSGEISLVPAGLSP